MKREDSKSGTEPKEEQRVARLQLPGFVNDEDMGLGDVIKQVTGTVGIRPCGGCERRAAALNRLLLFSAKRPK